MFKLLPVLVLGGAIAWYWQPIDGWIDPDRAAERRLPECADDCAPRSFSTPGVRAARSGPAAPRSSNALFGTAPVKNGGKTSPNSGGYSRGSGRAPFSTGGGSGGGGGGFSRAGAVERVTAPPNPGRG